MKNKNITSKIQKFWNYIKSFRETTVLSIVILFSLGLAILSEHFFTYSNIRSVSIAMSSRGIMVIGMTIALISGGFDLSVGSVMALSGTTTGLIFSTTNVSIWIAVLGGLLVALICGAINGLLIGKVGLNPLITTLGMMQVARGLVYVQTEGTPISLSGAAKSFNSLGNSEILGIPSMVFIMLVLVVIMDYLMRNSSILRKVFYVGSNEKSARLSGISVTKVKIGVYIFTALLAGIAGILTASRFGMASSSTGNGEELIVIASAVIGGASLQGGAGTIYGSLLGVILFSLINNSLVLLNIPVYYQNVIIGLILIISVIVDHISQKRRQKRLVQEA